MEMASVLRGYRGYHQRLRRHLDLAKASQQQLAQRAATLATQQHTDKVQFDAQVAALVDEKKVCAARTHSHAHVSHSYVTVCIDRI